LRILAFNAGLAIVTGIFFGLAPAMQSMRFNLWSTLKDASGAVTGGSSPVRLRKALVTAQVALSFLLLVGAGLFVKTLANLRNTNSGFRNIDNLIAFQVDPASNGYSVAQIMAFYRDTPEKLRSIPGVTSATAAFITLLSGDEWDSTMGVEGHQAKDGEDMQAFMNAVSPGFLKTMGIPLLEGREFDERDQGKDFSVAIVSRSFATHFFGNRSPIGRHIGFGIGPKSKLNIEIVGMAENSLVEGPREGLHRQVYVPLVQSNYPAAAVFYVRTGLESTKMFTALRRKMAEIDPALPTYDMKTLEGQLDETLSTERLVAMLSAAFGVLATLLAALGLYGVLAFVVARRTREIGLRMALGAGRGLVVWMVLREALRLLAIGLAISIPSAYVLSRYVGSQLFGVKPTDIGTAAIAVVVLGVVVAVAGALPARRASGIDPIKALRYE
jgi:predicted permease